MNDKYIKRRDELIEQGYSRPVAMAEARREILNEVKTETIQDSKEQQVQDIQDT